MLESSQILQVDATVIAGILILLTIKSKDLKSIPLRFLGLSYTPYEAAAYVAVCFSLSAILEIVKSIAHPDITNNVNFVAVMNILSPGLPSLGFAFVIIVVVYFARANRKEPTT